MGVKISQLTEALSTVITDIFHLRTTGGIDKKITFANLLGFGALNTYFKGQGAGIKSIYEKLTLRDTGVKIGTFTLDGSGTANITGVGFRPAILIFFCSLEITEAQLASWGFDDGGTHYCIYKSNNPDFFLPSIELSIYIYLSGTNSLEGYISSIDVDGFTIEHTELGSIPRIRIIYLALP